MWGALINICCINEYINEIGQNFKVCYSLIQIIEGYIEKNIENIEIYIILLEMDIYTCMNDISNSLYFTNLNKC